jgi:hypothetical protein
VILGAMAEEWVSQARAGARTAVGSLRQVARAVGAFLLLAAIHAYRLLVSPGLGPCCRYEPSCSAYATEAVVVHGPWRGAWLAARRLLRCHPLHPGGFDPVPRGGGGGA